MSDTTGTALPDELVDKILWDLDDWNLNPCTPSKRGLAACSQTCRHWAKSLRSVLWYCITLRSMEDTSQLLNFATTPDFLGRPLRSCVKYLHIVEDRSSSGLPWGHQIHLRLLHVLNINTVDWKISGNSSTTPLLPLPRTIPSRPLKITGLVLADLQLPCFDTVARFLDELHICYLKLENVTLSEEDLMATTAPRSFLHRRPSHIRIRVIRSAHVHSDLPSWLRLCHLLCVNRFQPILNSSVEALVVQHLQLLVSFHNIENDVVANFSFDGGVMDSAATTSCKCTPLLCGPLLVIL